MVAFMDRTGVRYGSLIAVRRIDQPGGRPKWECVCDCGNKATVNGHNLTSGNTRSCGCLWQSVVKKDMLGKRFGRLVVSDAAEAKKYNGSRMAMYRCKCDCGNEVVTLGMSLRNGDTTSCGCLLRETGRKNGLSAFVDLSGKKYGRLTVLRREDTVVGSGNAKFLCLCECGNKAVVRGNSLVGGRTISCGCAKAGKTGSRSDTQRAASRLISMRRRAKSLGVYKPFDSDILSFVEEESVSLAFLRNKITNVAWEIDHIIPLKGPVTSFGVRVVTGIHNELNIRVVTAKENCSRRNRYWPDMP